LHQKDSVKSFASEKEKEARRLMWLMIATQFI